MCDDFTVQRQLLLKLYQLLGFNRPYRDTDVTVLFLHIPKCAGTTLTEDVIMKIFPRRQRLLYYDGDTRSLLKLLQEMPARRRMRLRCIAGHFAFGVHQLLPGRARYITLLREPVDRVISHFYFVMRTRGHYLYEQVAGGSISLRDYVEKLGNIEMDNGQTRILAGIGHGAKFGACTQAMLDVARENLQQHFAAVGISERFDDFLRLVQHRLGWSIPRYKIKNAGSNCPQAQTIDPATRAAIIEHNRLDIELYRHAVELFENQLRDVG
jgi:hypothetical protein